MADEQDPNGVDPSEEGIIIPQGEEPGDLSGEGALIPEAEKPAGDASAGSAPGTQSGDEGDEPPKKDGIVMEF